MAKSESFGLWINPQLLSKSKQALTFIEGIANENSFAFHDVILGVLWQSLSASRNNTDKKKEDSKSLSNGKTSEVKITKGKDNIKTSSNTLTKGKTLESCPTGKQYVTIPQTVSEFKKSAKAKSDKESNDTNIEVISIEDDDCEIVSADEDEKVSTEKVNASIEEEKLTPTKKVLVENVECSYFDMDCEEINDNDNDTVDEAPTTVNVAGTTDNDYQIEVNVGDDTTVEVNDSLFDSIGIQRKVQPGNDNSKDISTVNPVTKVTKQSSSEPVPSTSWAGRDNSSSKQKDLSHSNSRDSVDGDMVSDNDYQVEDKGKKTKSRTRRSVSLDKCSEESQTPRKKRLLDHDKKWHMAPKHSLDQDKYLALPGGLDGDNSDDDNTNLSEADSHSSPVVKIEKLDADCDNHVKDFKPDDYFNNTDVSAKSTVSRVSKIKRGSKSRGRPKDHKTLEAAQKVIAGNPKKTRGFVRGKRNVNYSLLAKMGYHVIGKSEHEKSRTGLGVQVGGKPRGVGRGMRRGRAPKYTASDIGKVILGLKSKKETNSSVSASTSNETKSKSDVSKSQGKRGRSRKNNNSSKKSVGRVKVGKKSNSTDVDSECDVSSVNEEGFVEESEWTTLDDEKKMSQHKKSIKSAARSRRKSSKGEEYYASFLENDDKESEDELSRQNKTDMSHFMSSPVVKIQKLDADFDNLLKGFKPDQKHGSAHGRVQSPTRITRGTRSRGRPRGRKLNLGNRLLSNKSSISTRGLGRGRKSSISVFDRLGYRGTRGTRGGIRGHHEISRRGRGRIGQIHVRMLGKMVRGVCKGSKGGRPSSYTINQQRKIAAKQLETLKLSIKSTKSNVDSKTSVVASTSCKTEDKKTDKVIKRKRGRPRKVSGIGRSPGRPRKVDVSDSDLSNDEEQDFEECEITTRSSKKIGNKNTDVLEPFEESNDIDSDCLIMDNETLFGGNGRTVNSVPVRDQGPEVYIDSQYEGAQDSTEGSGTYVSEEVGNYFEGHYEGASGDFVGVSNKETTNYSIEGATNYISDGATNYVTEGTTNNNTDGATLYVTEGATIITSGATNYATDGPSNYVSHGTTNYASDGPSTYVTHGATNYGLESATDCVTEGASNYITDENGRMWNYAVEHNVHDDPGNSQNDENSEDIILID